ncbi:MAG: C_GCAxxG_C_C family protein [Prolixibacteraceae bacterium]|nr:C_GCAxxG_C_C family protein [Prolixibacteraceae bacterium]
MNKTERAVENFKTMNCNQAVLSVFGPGYGLSECQCLAIGLSFAGGMARQGKTCGAVTGAYTVIGLWASGKPGTPDERKELAFSKVREFNKLFIQEHNELDCEKLLENNMSIPEKYEKIKELGYFQSRCPKFIGTSANILCQILD